MVYTLPSCFRYNYVNIDDCWAVARDNKTGVIVADPKAFPKGMKALADYVHNLNFKFGIYTDRGTATCVGRPGSQGYLYEHSFSFFLFQYDEIFFAHSVVAAIDHMM